MTSDKDKKVIVIGGYVFKHGKHYVSPQELSILYKVNKARCLFAKDRSDEKLRGIDLTKHTVLEPREDGNYER